MTPAERSARSKKGARSKRRMLCARGPDDRGGAPRPAPMPTKAERVGDAAVIAATTPYKSSAQIGKELGLTAASVRAAWRRRKIPRRPAGKRPPPAPTPVV